jgi:MinD-like ATPase involved in chromosome partitioning or flagellar assembly
MALPSLILVGAPEFAEYLKTCGAQWDVFPAVPTVNKMWDEMESGSIPPNPSVVIITDGTGSVPDEIESTLAALAPFTSLFLVADPQKGLKIVARAKELAGVIKDANANAPIHVLPGPDLIQALLILKKELTGKVDWATQSPAPVVQAPPAAPVAAPVIQAPPAAPVIQAPPAAPVVAPVLPPIAISSESLAPGSVYSPEVSAQASQTIAKRTDARQGQLTIAVMSSKGGSGKSTTAMCLAATIARASAAAGAPKKVVLVDLDIRDGQVGSLMAQYMPTAINIRITPVWNAATITSNLVHDAKLGIDALLAPSRPRTADAVGPDFYRKIIQVLQTTHDLVVLDCSVNYLDPLLGMAFAISDEILFVTTLATTSVQGMARSLTELFADPLDGGMGIDRAKVGVVANQVIRNVGMEPSKLMQGALGSPIVGQIPAEYDAVLLATNKTRMQDLLIHPTLGPAYFKLAQKCLENHSQGWPLAPFTPESAKVVVAQDSNDAQKPKGIFGKR